MTYRPTPAAGKKIVKPGGILTALSEAIEGGAEPIFIIEDKEENGEAGKSDGDIKDKVKDES